MNIELRHGPKDGDRRFLPLGKAADTMIIEVKDAKNNVRDYLYKKTSRLTADGYIVYQCLGLISELSAA